MTDQKKTQDSGQVSPRVIEGWRWHAEVMVPELNNEVLRLQAELTTLREQLAAALDSDLHHTDEDVHALYEQLAAVREEREMWHQRSDYGVKVQAQVEEYAREWRDKFQAAESALAAVEGKAVREFKMQGGPPIPWSLAQRIYDETYSRFYGTGQSLERIHERGGFGWGEVKMLYERLNKHDALSPEVPHGL